MQLIDGKATATAIKAEIAQEVNDIVARGGKRPHLAAVLVGHDGGSETYVKNKVLACEACGFKSTLIRYEDDITEAELLECVNRLNNDADIDGFIVQLPLPKHIDEQKIIEAIIFSMTPKERHNPEILNLSRKQRIAKGAGRDIKEVNQLIKQFDQMRKVLRMFSGPGGMANMAKMAGMMKGGFPGGMPKL